jgi:peptidoglycan/xylan/chitin deacetylase (PgdA/CDA1 family)
MKYVCVSFLLLFAILQMACASSSVSRTVNTVSQPLPVDLSLPNLSAAKAKEAFEYALENIKMNTPLFNKYFDGGTNIVSGYRFVDAKNIAVKGEARIGGSEFRVSYDLINAVQISENHFLISFYMEDITNGVSRFDELIWSPAEDESGLLLSFDDDYRHAWHQYFVMFERYDAKVTFFVQGSLEPDENFSLTGVSPTGQESIADFCFEALSRSHDLGFHTANHYDLTKVSRDEFYAETIDAAGAFSKAGIHFSAFAFPFGFSQSWMHEALAPVFSLTRGYGTRICFYNSEITTGEYIVSKAIDNIVYPDDDVFENEISLILLAAKFTGFHVVPFTTHDISDTAHWGIKPERLEFLLKTAQKLKLRFYTYSSVRH